MYQTSLAELLRGGLFFFVLFPIITGIVSVVIAYFVLSRYLKLNKFITYKELLVSPHAPSVSVIFPVEKITENTIVQIKALIAQQYNNFEIVVVTDGCPNDDFKNLIDDFELRKVDRHSLQQLKSAPIHAFYKSSNAAYSRLIVADKALGGRFDALNAGINISESDLVLCVERDCYLDQQAILKLVKSFLNSDEKVIASSGMSRTSDFSENLKHSPNESKGGRSFLRLFQLLAYLKISFIEKLSWSSLNGIHLSEGAATLYDKEIMLYAGAYSIEAIFPEIELMFSMRRYLYKNLIKHRVVYVPEFLFWSKYSVNYKPLGAFMIEYTNARIAIFRKNKDLFFNSAYGMFGLLNLPILFLIDVVKPLIKLGLLISIVVMLALGLISLDTIFLVLILTYVSVVLYTLIALLFNEYSSRGVQQRGGIFKLILMTFIEPIVYEPLKLYWALAGLLVKRT